MNNLIATFLAIVVFAAMTFWFGRIVFGLVDLLYKPYLSRWATNYAEEEDQSGFCSAINNNDCIIHH